jgi:ABC-2 type transport system ATP-binding protein
MKKVKEAKKVKESDAMSDDPREVVRIEEVVKDFRPGFGLRVKRVLHGISFSVREGEIFGFVGPNGAGKTTLLKVLMGLIRATSGRAEVLGHDVGETDFRRHVGFLPENPYFYDFLTGREILDFYARLSGVARERRSDRVSTLLDWVGLSHAADDRLRTYSKGMLQRTGIAQALVHDPSVIFLDEPMSGLDPIGRKEIRDLILRLRGEGKTVFMNTHILSDVEMVCDRVAIIVHGRIRYEGWIEKFLDGGERRSEMVVTGIAPEIAVRLEERLQAELRGHGQRVAVRLADKHVSEALGLVLGSGGEVVSLTPERASLEEIFMTAVQDDRSSAASSSIGSTGSGGPQQDASSGCATENSG